MKSNKDIITSNRLRCINAMILCAIVIIGVFIGVVTKLVTMSTAADSDEGLRSFRYFTVLSNMFMALASTLCIPFVIEGLRNHNYHLPRWIVEVLYCAVCCVTVTFTVAVCLLAPSQGFYATLLQRANLYLHLICPIAAMLLFIVVNGDHHIPFKHSFIVLIPLLSYAFIYWVEVFVIGDENGGWRDHYYTNAFVPYWVALIALPIIGITMANVVRLLHNKRHRLQRQETENYYMTSPEYEFPDIKGAVAKLAEREKASDHGGEVIVPRRLLIMLEKRYQSGLTIEELCKDYLHAYLSEE